MKNVWVTSCSHSHGCPISRVTMSNNTVVEKPNSSTPQRIISAISSRSSACHLRWRCRLSSSLSAICMMGLTTGRRAERAMHSASASLDRRLRHGHDQVLDLDRVRSELLGELVEVGTRDLLEAALVDVVDDLDADGL